MATLGQVGRDRSQRSEQSTVGKVGTSGEKERIGSLLCRIQIRRPDSECQRPKGSGSTNANDIIMLILKLAFKLAGDRIERQDFPAAELSDKDLVTECSKITRSKGQPPGRVEPIAMLKPHQKAAFRGEDVHKPLAGVEWDFDKVLSLILFGVGDVKVVTNV